MLIIVGIYFGIGATMLVYSLLDPWNMRDYLSLPREQQIMMVVIFLVMWPRILWDSFIA